MAPYYPSQIFPYPPIEGDQAQSQQVLHPSTHANDPTCKFPFPILFNTTQDQEVIHRDHASQQQQQQLLLHPEPFGLLLMGEQSENYGYNDHNAMDQTMCDPCLGEDDPIQGSSKWMSSKMRIMKKMLKYSKPREQGVQEIHDQQQSNQESTTTNPGAIIRVCSDCNTTKTPLWRSGPRGPKSLCNACGIRQRKARRAAAAAAALGGGGGLVSPPSSAQRKVRKDERPDVDCSMPFKKRCRFSNAGAARKKLCFDETAGMHRGFPQDERDAAILLMALSCGLVDS